MRRAWADELDPAAVLQPHRPATVRAHRSGPAGLDMNEYRLGRFVDRAEHGHIAKAHEKLADANRVNFHRGSRSWRRMMDDWQPVGRSSLTFCD